MNSRSRFLADSPKFRLTSNCASCIHFGSLLMTICVYPISDERVAMIAMWGTFEFHLGTFEFQKTHNNAGLIRASCLGIPNDDIPDWRRQCCPLIAKPSQRPSGDSDKLKWSRSGEVKPYLFGVRHKGVQFMHTRAQSAGGGGGRCFPSYYGILIFISGPMRAHG